MGDEGERKLENDTKIDVDKKSDSIEIPIGRFFERARENPWMIASVVLGLVLILVLIFGGGIETISPEDAGKRVLDFINSNPDLVGQVSLVSVEREGVFYLVILNYKGSEVPLYLTVDGKHTINGKPIEFEVKGDDTEEDGNRETVVSIDDVAMLGDVDAPVTIIEFSDYQCPFCSKFWRETLPLIKSNYIDTGKVRFVYRDYPLPNHVMARPAAEATECVRALGGDEAFWEMHDKIFENQDDLDVVNLEVWAEEIGYDISDCMDSGEMRAEVQKDFMDGGSLATPTFFINGKKIEGAQPYSVFEQIIEAELAGF